MTKTTKRKAKGAEKRTAKKSTKRKRSSSSTPSSTGSTSSSSGSSSLATTANVGSFSSRDVAHNEVRVDFNMMDAVVLKRYKKQMKLRGKYSNKAEMVYHVTKHFQQNEVDEQTVISEFTRMMKKSRKLSSL
eukprot:CAMPEP_0177639168 /NCGR_PEP_ID=MMETSP0447-20121125/5878_1 /TAXON_ID=0 /ORGANISM="Stygamoeba regulata, Strain BSH-02190019" /LENGTH=131 /DNA_ID=CAMNT_0019141179 /DNA_START=31 /DNA_END=426 /DNA_ORIENTATION=+